MSMCYTQSKKPLVKTVLSILSLLLFGGIVSNLSIAQENTAPVFSDGDHATRSVAENTASGERIGDPISATDADVDDKLRYRLSGTDANWFRVGKKTGQLRTRKPLDYEVKSSYFVTITVSDGNGGKAAIDVTIHITDVDENLAPVFAVANAQLGAEEQALRDVSGPTVLTGRTPQVQAAIVLAARVDSAADVTDAHLAAIYQLDLSNQSISSLKSGDFGGLTVLEHLHLQKNSLTALPAGIFDELTGLIELNLWENALTALPAGVFDALTNLERLNLWENELTALPAGIFDELTGLIELNLWENALTALPAGVFDALTNLERLNLSHNALTALPAGVFDALTNLERLILYDNELTALPAGVFAKLTSLISLDLTNNALTALPAGVFGENILKDLYLRHNQISDVSAVEDLTSLVQLYLYGNPIADYDPLRTLLEKSDVYLDITIPPMFTEGDRATRSVSENTPSGANIGAPVSATDADSDTLTYTLGGTDAAAFSLVSDSGQLQTKAALDYERKTSYTVTITVSDGKGGSDTIDVTINVTDVREEVAPVFTDGATTTRSVFENVSAGQNIGEPVSATDANGDTLAYTLGGTDAAAFSLVSDSGQLQTKAALDYERKTSYTVTITVSDGNGGNDSITVTINVMNIGDPTVLAGRTPEVKKAILDRMPGRHSDDVSKKKLATIRGALDLNNQSITALKSGDFDGLTALEHLNLQKNSLTSLPADVFDELTRLKKLNLANNRISDVSALENLTSLTHLYLKGNPITDYGPLYRLRKKQPSLIIDIDIDANVSPLFTEGDSTTRSVPENTPSGQNIGDPVSATDANGDTLAYTLGGTDAASFSIVSTSGQLQTRAKVALDYEQKTSYTVTVTVSDGNDSSTDSITVTINITNVGDPTLLAGRTPKVKTAILAKLPGVDSADVTAADLAGISGELRLDEQQITALRSGDFDGLTNLEKLNLSNNPALTSLPAGIFDELTKLETLDLSEADLISLPAGVFDELTKLETLKLDYNRPLGSLPDGIFDELTNLTDLGLAEIGLTSLPAGIFDELTKLETLNLSFNSSLRSLPAGIFDELTKLETLHLEFTGLTSLPAGIFDELTKLETLHLEFTGLTSLPAGVFDELTNLEQLFLLQNKIKDVSAVENLTSLVELRLDGNPIADYGPLRRLKKKNPGVQLDIDIPPGAPALQALPEETALLTNYPNPFNPETWIPYELSKPAQVTVTLYNIQGVVVRELALGHKPAGVYRNRSRAVHWDGRNASGEKVATGVYFYTFTAGDYTATRKMLIRK